MFDLEAIIIEKEKLEERLSDFINKEIRAFQDKTGASARAVECSYYDVTAVGGKPSAIFRVITRFALCRGKVFIK
jgi:hypothetical protein